MKEMRMKNELLTACLLILWTSVVSVAQTPAPSIGLSVNTDPAPYLKLPASIVSTAAETPAGGANFVSFQQNAITTYNGYQYVVYWNAAYHVCAARRKIPTGGWQTIEFTDYTVTAARVADGHYSISIGICPNDGTVHLAFDHHGDNLHYRKSIAGLANNPDLYSWGISSFGAIQNYLIPGQPLTLVTYPRFVIKPNGDLLYEYRYGTSGGGDSYLYEYTASSSSWVKIGKYIDGLTLSNNAYLNGIHYDKNGRLHASWVWRETPDPFTNHDVNYMYSDDHGRTWMSNNGAQVGTVNTNPVSSSTSGIKIWSIGQKRGLINQESQVVDSKGGIHILQSYLLDSEANSTNFWNDRARAYLHHVYKNDAGVWQNDLIDVTSVNRSQIAIDEGDNLYIVSPNYRVYVALSADKWTKWTALDMSESSSAINEGLIDRELLLNESVLSFVFAQTGGKITVPYYLLSKSKPGTGSGLNTSVYAGPNFGSFLSQRLGTVNETSSDVTYSGDTVSIRCLGTLETMVGETYTLQFTTSGPAMVSINNVQVLNTSALSTTTTYPIVLKAQPSHKYLVKIEGKYATTNVVTKLEWESAHQTRELVPLTSLYGKLTNEVFNGIKPLPSGKLNAVCQPNPFIDNTNINISGQFDYKLYDASGSIVREGEAADHLGLGDNLSKGFYILNVVQNQKGQTIKMIKL